MIRRCFLVLIPGLILMLTAAIPNLAVAQKKSGSKVAANLEAAKELSAASGRPILAVAGLES